MNEKEAESLELSAFLCTFAGKIRIQKLIRYDTFLSDPTENRDCNGS